MASLKARITKILGAKSAPAPTRQAPTIESHLVERPSKAYPGWDITIESHLIEAWRDAESHLVEAREACAATEQAYKLRFLAVENAEQACALADLHQDIAQEALAVAEQAYNRTESHLVEARETERAYNRAEAHLVEAQEALAGAEQARNLARQWRQAAAVALNLRELECWRR